MSVSVQVSPQLSSLARAIGLVGPDGTVDAAWFEDPLERLRTIVSDPGQRAALLALIEELLPSAPPDGAAGTARWHRLLDPTWPGNVFLVVEDDIIGVAAAIGTEDSAAVSANASIRLPLVNLSAGTVEVIAGSARGPLDLEVRAAWDPGEHPSGVAVHATVDLEGHGALRVAFDDLDPARPGVRAELDPTRLDGDASRVLLQLLANVLADLPIADPRVARVSAHLPGVLGLDPALEPLPLGELLRDPGAIGRWFAAIAGDGTTLRAWFTHLAGLLGAGLPNAVPQVTNAGTPTDPCRASIVDLGGGSALELTLAATAPASGAPELLAGVALSLPASLARVEGAATLVALPLDGTSPARLLPAAHLALTAPPAGTIVDEAPTVKLGAISAGVAWDGTRVVPRLELLDVVLDGKPYARLDLTSASAVGEAATGIVQGALDRMLGTTGLGRALQALAGLVPPASDPASTNLLSFSALVENPTRAIADVHRRALADPLHPWSHLFAELATLVQAPGGVTGLGTAAAPWRIALAALGPATLELAAWNARAAETPPGAELLRLGIRVAFAEAPWSGGWTAELLAFDLRPGAPATASFLGAQHLELSVAPGPLPATAAGLQLALQALTARATWTPGGSSGWRLEAEQLTVTGSGGSVGPVTLRLPSAAFDAGAPDLGFGVPVDTLTALIRLLLSQLLHDVGGPAAFTVGALIGLHRALRGLPSDWPLLAPPVAGNFGSLLADPLAAVRAQLEAVAGGSSANGTPFLVSALPWVAALVERALPDDAVAALAGLAPRGLGTYDAPWAFPLLDPSLELLCWLEPDGPPKAWQVRAAERMRDAAGAGAFVALLGSVAPLVPELAAALRARGTLAVARRLERLSSWLSGGDGFVATAAQVVWSDTWAEGTTVLGAHHDQPSSPSAIAQIRAQLDAWTGAASRAVLLVGPPFADHRAWDDLLRAVEPARAAGAHFDFRSPAADPLAIALDHVDVVATHYTADLADGPLDHVAAQLGRAVERVGALTGAPKVLLVAHSVAGVAARAFAAAHAELVGGVITLGTPHGPSPLAPLVDGELAEAIRIAEALQPSSGRSPLGRAIGRLAELVDGASGYAFEAFPERRSTVDTVPGLAIPGAIEEDLLEDLTATAVYRISRAADGAAPATHVAIGARLHVDLPAAERGGLAAAARIRVDALRAGLGAAPREAGRLDRALHVRLDLRRENGWLAGGPGPGTPMRLRWAELGASVEAAAEGGVTVTPVLRLHEVGATTRRWIDGADVVAMAETLPPWLPLSAELPAAGTPDRLVLDVLEAAGIVTGDGTGRRALGLDALVGILRRPAEQLGARLPAIVDVLAAAVGARTAARGWALQLGAAPVELALDREPWSISIRTHDPATNADVLELAPGLAVGLDASATLATFAASADARLQLGEAILAWSSAAGTLTLSDGFSPAPLPLVPAPAAAALRAELARRLPPLVASAVASGVLGALGGGAVPVKGMARLFASPREWVLSPDGFGAAGGGLDAARITALLEAVDRRLGNATAGKLTLPGGVALAATGADPVRLALAGSIPLGPAGDALDLELGLAVDRALAATPTGRATFRVTLPGDWGRLAVSLGVDASGLAVSVAPSGVAAIELLPRFSGFGALASGAALLLPRVLQAAVDELAPVPQDATGLLRAALSLARALGIYDFDAQGFEAPARSGELARMLEPGWLQSKAASGPAVALLIEDLLGGTAPVVDVPGTVIASGATVSWRLPLGTGVAVTASLGWSGGAAEPSLLLGVEGVRLGPVMADELSTGYDEGIACHVALRLDPGGALSFLQPAVDLDVAGGRVSFEAYPLGAAEQADFTIRVAPVPELVLHPEAAVALLEKWGLPLAARLLVDELADRLEAEVWPGGPTIRSILEQAGVVVPGTSPPEVAASLPPPAKLALRALAALVTDVTIVLVPGELWLSLVEEGGRRGLRLFGRQTLSAGDLEVGLHFGDAEWLDDPAAGVTLWILEDEPEPPEPVTPALDLLPPVRLTPALDLTGFGVVLSRAGDPLLEGAFELGGAGGFLFLQLAFLDAARAPALTVSGLGAGIELDDARINVSSDDGDSFLKKLLPPELQAPFDLAVAWREGEGLTIHGGAPGGGLELTFPLDLDLVLLRIEELFLALRAQAGAASIEAALTGSAALGPIHASVQRVGIKATFASGGTRLAFRAPDGVALSIDAGPVSGGGFLFIDEPKGQYAGALQLQLQTLSITAIGLLNTKMPDGSPIPGMGFSLLVIIAVELPPIQLGFGFTLNGIGGLLGLNRTIDVAALRAGVRTRALDAMLFPPDPIANATSVVRSLSAVFPPATDRFVVGPMVRLGWGTPPILTLDLGVLIELPPPIRVVVLGRIKLALPQDDDVAVVLIHLDVVGIVDFDKGEVSIDAVLYDSLIAGFALSGEMALRARWKDPPAFAIAIGGFHPSFLPPPGFPTLSRIALCLATGDNPRLRLEAYLAVTSNTIQFGSAIDLHAEAAGFAIDGDLAFDALIQLDPFGLMADMAGSVSVTYDGDTICAVSVAVHLTGPAPWHVWGKAKVEVLCFSATVDFDARFGEAALPPPPPPVRVSDLLLASIVEPANWSAQPPQGESVVGLRSLPGGARVLAHPLGGLTFRQRVAPLELTLTRYGAAPVDGPARLELGEVRCAGQPVRAEDRDDVKDAFAAAQFLDLSDDEKLSRPSFEQFTSGVTLRFDGWAVDELAAGEAAPLGYDVIVVDEEEDGSAPDVVTLDAAVAVGLAASGPAAASQARRGGLRRFEAKPAKVRLEERRFGVVGGLDSRAPVTTAATYAQAIETARRLGKTGERLSVVRLTSEDPE